LFTYAPSRSTKTAMELYAGISCARCARHPPPELRRDALANSG
jgi:hypothetical protein